MSIRRFHPFVLPVPFMALVVALLTIPAFGQGRPSPPSVDMTSANQFSQEQRERLIAWVNYYAKLMQDAAATLQDVETARNELQRPLTNPGVTNFFRGEYSRLVVPELEKVITGTNLHASINALVLASLLESERAASFLLTHVHIQDQSNWQMRLRAAAGAAHVLKGNWIEARRVKPFINTLKDAALREDQPLVLRHHLAAIDALDRQPFNDQERAEVRSTLVETLNTLIDRVAQKAPEDPMPMLQAIWSGTVLVRSKFLMGLSREETKSIGSKLGPRLGKLLNIVNQQWQQAQSDERKKREYAAMVGTWEGFLVQVDTIVRNNTAQEVMKRAWDSGDKSGFESQLQTWEAALKQQPYGS